MKIDKTAAISYVVERAKEASTWQGVVFILTAAGASIRQDAAAAIGIIGTAVAGVIGAALPNQVGK